MSRGEKRTLPTDGPTSSNTAGDLPTIGVGGVSTTNGHSNRSISSNSSLSSNNSNSSNNSTANASVHGNGNESGNSIANGNSNSNNNSNGSSTTTNTGGNSTNGTHDNYNHSGNGSGGGNGPPQKKLKEKLPDFDWSANNYALSWRLVDELKKSENKVVLFPEEGVKVCLCCFLLLACSCSLFSLVIIPPVLFSFLTQRTPLF